MNPESLIPDLPFPQQWLPSDVYLVGGTVRDRLLHRKRKTFDLDLILEKQAVEVAREIAKRCQAGFVVLDAQRDIARIVFAEGTVDVAKIEGETIEQDLLRRDFTINAIALHLHDQTLIDPLQGKQDLEAKIIKMVSPANLKEDPLRLLRAYRQGGQLNFSIDRATSDTIAEIAPCIQEVAAERIQNELSYLLPLPRVGSYLQQAWEDGILSPWLPSLTAQQVEQVAQVETSKQQLNRGNFNLKPAWENNVGGESDTLESLAKLACLVSADPQQAENQLTTLKYSRGEVRTVTSTLSLLPQLLEQNPKQMTKREQYFFFQDAVKVFPCLLLTAMAKGLTLDWATPLIERYLNPKDPIAYPQPILTGKDLLRSLSLSPSPLIGTLLRELQIAHIEGKIHTRDQALNFAQSWLDSQ